MQKIAIALTTVVFMAHSLVQAGLDNSQSFRRALIA